MAKTIRSALLVLIWAQCVVERCCAQATGGEDTLSIHFDPQDYTTTFGEPAELQLWINGAASRNLTLRFGTLGGNYVNISPDTQWIRDNEVFINSLTIVQATGIRQGRFIVEATVEPEGIVDDHRLFVNLKVALSQPLIYISLVIGWAYTACWSIGYYPQIFLNHRKKSVVGLSFDFLHINIVGHICYAFFNSFLYWSKYIEEEYFDRHPHGLNPVIGNDVGFAIHACVATGYTILQCYMYESGGNTVSRTAKTIIGTYLVLIVVSFCLVLFKTFHWLDFLYVLSYLKLSTTLVKYFPQAYMNYKRKSTAGFAISNRLLDLAGGLFSILQMVINAWNFDDWQSILGDPVKFGLGVFSILFDVVFIVQHYVLYRSHNLNVPSYHVGKGEDEQMTKF